MLEFIFMLTRNDATVPDAMAVYEGLRDSDLRYVGFKGSMIQWAVANSLSLTHSTRYHMRSGLTRCSLRTVTGMPPTM